MNIDIESIRQALVTLGTTLTLLKQAKDLLPENSQKQELSTAIELAERQLKIGESQTAHALGYELCRTHFPPEVMLSSDDQNWRCPIYGNDKYTGRTTGGGFAIR